MEQSLAERLAAAIDNPEKLTKALAALVATPPLSVANLDEASLDDQRTAAALASEEYGEIQNEVFQVILAGYTANRILAAVNAPAASLPTEAQLDPLWEKLRRMAETVQPPDDGQGDVPQVQVSDKAPI